MLDIKVLRQNVLPKNHTEPQEVGGGGFFVFLVKWLLNQTGRLALSLMQELLSDGKNKNFLLVLRVIMIQIRKKKRNRRSLRLLHT